MTGQLMHLRTTIPIHCVMVLEEKQYTNPKQLPHLNFCTVAVKAQALQL